MILFVLSYEQRQNQKDNSEMTRKPNLINETSIDNHLPEIMANRGISIRGLSNATNITYTMVRDIYHGNRESAKFKTLDKICEVLSCDIGDIYKRVR